MLLQCVCELRKGGELVNVKGALSLSVGTHGTEACNSTKHTV